MLVREIGLTSLSDLDAMPVDEFILHMADYNDQPWGSIRDVALQMQISEFRAFYQNIKTAKDSNRAKADDFMPIKHKTEAKEQDFNALSEFIEKING